jgi:aryl-alcohol dehydrogenase-like predicted oxidoreductase
VEHLPMGRSGLMVASACLGAMNFGSSAYFASCDKAQARRIVDAYIDAGGNFMVAQQIEAEICRCASSTALV